MVSLKINTESAIKDVEQKVSSEELISIDEKYLENVTEIDNSYRYIGNVETDIDCIFMDAITFYPIFEKNNYMENEKIKIIFDAIFPKKPVELKYETNGFDVINYPTFLNEHSIGLNVVSRGKLTEHYISLTATFSDGISIEACVFGILTDQGLFLTGSSYESAWDLYYKSKLEKGTITEAIYKDSLNQMYSRAGVETSLISTSVKNLPSAQILFTPQTTTIKGTLGWDDDSNVWHPLQYTKVEIRDNMSSTLIATVYTDSSGTYNYSYFDSLTRNIFIKVYPAGENIVVKTGTGGEYSYTSGIRAGITPGTTLDISWEVDMSTNLGQAFQISQAAITAARYATTMNGEKLSDLTIKYPHNESSSCFYRRSEKTIYMLGRSGVYSYLPNSYASWDVVMHEYGHHVQAELDITDNPGGSHSFTNNLADLRNSKDIGIRLAWGEAYPSVFGGMAQAFYSSVLQNIATVGDANYSSYNGATLDYETTSFQSDACEGAIIGVLWDLYDSGLELHDTISLEHSEIWSLMKNCGAKTMSQFAEYFTKNYTINNIYKLGSLLSYHGMAVSNLSVDNSGSFPKFSWTANGTSPTYKNNLFELVFFNSNNQEILRIKNIADTSYTLNSTEWNSILFSYGTTYNVVVVANQTDSPVTGNYYSGNLSVTKSTYNSSGNYSFTDGSRYMEKQFTLSPGSYYDYIVTFDMAGSKTIQTFGDMDTCIYLYDLNGTLLASNDDSGYSYNALICYCTNANTEYRIRIKFYNSAAYGTTKLAITPAYGLLKSDISELSCYENIYSLSGETSYSLSSTVQRYYTEMITFNAPSVGNYMFELSSTFDNYIYVIDPRSSDYLVSNLDYNDDGGIDYNAKLRRRLDTGIPYLIIYSQYNLSAEFTDLDEGDDVVVNISAVENNTLSENYIGGVYEIWSLNQFNELRTISTSGKIFKMMNDIDLGASFDNPWNPIPEFEGVLNGNGYTISNINIKTSAKSGYFGLFSTNSGRIENLTVDGNIYIDGQNSGQIIAGMVVGVNWGSGVIYNCQSCLPPPGNFFASTQINNNDSYTAWNFEIYSSRSYSEIGGICGHNQGTISYCVSYADIFNKGDIGGISGTNHGGTIQNSTNNGELNYWYADTNRCVGGVTGYFDGGTISNCRNQSPIKCVNPSFSHDTSIHPSIAQIIGRKVSGANYGNTFDKNADYVGKEYEDYEGCFVDKGALDAFEYDKTLFGSKYHDQAMSVKDEEIGQNG